MKPKDASAPLVPKANIVTEHAAGTPSIFAASLPQQHIESWMT